MEENNNDETKSRRSFLGEGAKLGLLAAAGSAVIAKVFGNKLKEETSAETVELMSTDGTLLQVPASEVHHVQEKKVDYDPREGFHNRKFVMVVDLAKCRNAKKCQSSCNKNHYITGDNAWIKIYKMQDNEKSAPYWQPTLCMQCDEPPCVKVCPVDATFKRRDGIVLIDKGEMPHCVSACPNDVFSFGDLYEDTVTNGSGQSFKLSKLLKDRAGYRLMENLGTKPSVYYLPPVDRVQEFEEGLSNYTEFKSVDKADKPQ